jgi:hypothetical protein
MAIRTLAQLRQTAPEEFKSLSDRDLIEAYSSTTGVPFSDAADFFQLPRAGMLREMGGQLAAGLTVDLPRMVGQSTKYFADDDSAAYARGQQIVESSERRGLTRQADVRGRGFVGRGMIEGSRALVPTTATIAAGLGGGLAAGPVGAVAAGGVAATGLFGGSAAQESYERVLEETGDAQAARSAARGVLAVQGIGETVATAAGAALLRPLARGLSSAKSMKDVTNRFTDPRMYRDYFKALPGQYATQIGTEVGQDVGTSLIEQRYGASPEDLSEIALTSARAAFGLTTLLGGFGLGSATVRQRNADRLKAALEGDPSIPAEEQQMAVMRVRQEAEAAGIAPERAQAWAFNQLRRIDNVVNKPTEKLETAASRFVEAELALQNMDESNPEYQNLLDAQLEARNEFIELGDKPSTFTAIDKETNEPRVLTYAELNALGNGLTVPWVSRAAEPTQIGLENDSEIDLSLQPDSIETAEGYLSAVARMEVLRAREAEAQAAAASTEQEVNLSGADTTATTTDSLSEEDIEGILDSLEAAYSPQPPAGQQTQQAKDPQALVDELGLPFDATEMTPQEMRAAAAKDIVADDKAIEKILKAEAEGSQAGKSPGRISMPQEVFKAIRNAILNPGNANMFKVRKRGVTAVDEELTAQYAPKIQAVAQAATEYGQAYDRILTRMGNLLRSSDKAPGAFTEDIAEFNAISRITGDDVALAEIREKVKGSPAAVENITKRDESVPLTEILAQYNQAKQNLLESLEGNGRDMDVVTALLKQRVQQKTQRGSIDRNKRKRWVSADTQISRAWNAARRGGDTDILDVRPTETRRSAESRDPSAPLAAIFRDNLLPPQDGTDTQTASVKGLTSYYTKQGTGYEKILAKTLSVVFDNMGDFAPTFVVHTRGSKNRENSYDPATNVVSLADNASASVILHELLHGALQWYVYSNQSNPAVVQLLEQAEAIAKMDVKGQPESVKKVQAVIRRLLKPGTQTGKLDAVLELISYGNTLNDFRKATEALPSRGASLSFVNKVKNFWRNLESVMRNLLGLKSKSAAADIITNTFNLLDGASAVSPEGLRAAMEAASEGAKLENVVEGTDIPSSERQTAAGPLRPPLDKAEFAKFSKTVMPTWLSTRPIFEAFGGWWGKSVDKAGAEIEKLNTLIQKETPGLANAISWINNYYGHARPIVDLLIRAKDDRRGGGIVAELVGRYISELPTQDMRALIPQMDAMLNALRQNTPMPKLDGVDSNTAELFGSMMERYWEMAKAIRDEKLRDKIAGRLNTRTGVWEGGKRFSEAIILPEDINAVASATFGQKPISKFIKERTKREISLDAIRTRRDANNNPILTDDFIGLYRRTPEFLKERENGLALAERLPDEFVNIEDYRAGKSPLYANQSMEADTATVWRVGKYSNKGFVMNASTNIADITADKKSQAVALGIRNTMQIMANYYSSDRLSSSLANYKRGTPEAVAYDSLEELNSVINGTFENDKFVPQTDKTKWKSQLFPNNIADAAKREAKSSVFRDMARTTNSWVRVPKEGYGELSDKIVSGSVWNTIQDEYDTRPFFNARAANNIMRYFKKAKTQYNPATWGTNVFTNFTMAMMDDIPMATISQSSRLYFGFMAPELAKKAGIVLTRQERDIMMKLVNTNALLGNFSSSEIKESVYEAMRSNLAGEEQGLASRVMQFTGLEKSRLEWLSKLKDKVDDGATEWYAAQDNVFRIASALNYLGRLESSGKPIDAEAYRLAGDHSRFAFLDYDISSKAVKIMRQTAFPFISWPYAAAKLIGNVAVNKPWKLVNLYAGYAVLDGLLRAVTDDDEEMRAIGPKWARERLLFGMGPYSHVRIPFLGDDENPVYYNLGKYMAPSSFGERVPNPFMGLDWWPSALSPGGPFLSSVLLMVGGVDPFTGNKLSPPTASGWENMGKRMQYTSSLMAPNIPFISPTETQRFMEAIQSREDRSDSYFMYYMARLGGMRLYDFNKQGAEDAQFRALRAIKSEFDREISRLRRAELRLENPDMERFYRKRDKLEARLQERLAELTGDDNNL